VGPWVNGGIEDKAQPLQAGLWIEVLILELHREGARWLIAPGSPPVDQLGFRTEKEMLIGEAFVLSPEKEI